MEKKSFIVLLLGFFAWIFFVSGAFNWLAIPSFDRLLTTIFGKSNFLNNLLIILISSVIVYSIVWIAMKRNKHIA
ncbi:hypothetical protein I6J18_01315 [Peribacillus psychrosaccharolyticus]|uniref:Uncharacterized protein n=1 Tax=Peribacillus psychrosaccharolyticus TaxID=1407 RepID=A0A974S0J9_PERPY|nr:hypothetical protein [Peribacillus psychrosaccharolyticus]MEC2056206.1 hypothetical protein [Peribacillus psychrosaccharolyticus]MED3743609.1 hypothetical protein [Peribacillus psychrosaccharolyticus]QQT00609.1 hypothetical protein I6J18_01315 [Peribacillus psychrosaccharolyticus]